MTVHIDIDPTTIAAFCRRHQIRKMSLFGSVIREDFTPNSDIDVIVEFKPNTRVGFRFVTIADELSDLLGRKVDLHTPNSLSLYFRDEVLREALPIYVEA